MDATTAGALLTAAAEGNLERLKQMVARFNDVEAFGRLCETVKDESGWTALHFSAAAGKTRVCKYLIEKLKLDVNLKTVAGGTPLILAVTHVQFPTANYLIECGADINETGFGGMTALHFAACSGSKKLMRLLISKGSNVEAISVRGTPLQVAAESGKKEAIRILLDNVTDPNSTRYMWGTPIMLSIKAGSFECLYILLKAGCDPNITSIGGSTPLHIAVEEEENEFIKVLLRAGADPNLVDVAGSTPLEHAAFISNHAAMVILFPETSQIPSIPDWSIDGVASHVNSEEAMQQRALKMKECTLLAKQRGAAAFKENDYISAFLHYNEACCFTPDDHTVLSNRSVCWARMGVGPLALLDAQACVLLKPEWPKAHYREGAAWMVNKNYSKAAEAFTRALTLDPKNKEILQAFREAVEADSMKIADSIGEMKISIPSLSPLMRALHGSGAFMRRF